MVIPAKTLIHKASMPIARHAVRTFCATHRDYFRELEIHTDGSLTEAERNELSVMAWGMPFRFVEPQERRGELDRLIGNFPATKAFLNGQGYRSKMELPIISREPYFYFDSDIVWLRSCGNLTGNGLENLFSTETWTWYPGIRHDLSWTRANIPRRVNSGFYYLADPFPFDRMERLLTGNLYNPEAPYATDQEIMAFLYPGMLLYHPDDLMRSRRAIVYDLRHLKAVALHFPGRMWEAHLDQLDILQPAAETAAVRFVRAVSLKITELLRMHLAIGIAQSAWSRLFILMYRKIRAQLVARLK